MIYLAITTTIMLIITMISIWQRIRLAETADDLVKENVSLRIRIAKLEEDIRSLKQPKVRAGWEQ